MKTAIHPTLNLASINCSSCGTSFVTHSSAGDVTVEVCSQCHPAYTGRVVTLSTGSRIERFQRRLEQRSV